MSSRLDPLSRAKKDTCGEEEPREELVSTTSSLSRPDKIALLVSGRFMPRAGLITIMP